MTNQSLWHSGIRGLCQSDERHEISTPDFQVTTKAQVLDTPSAGGGRYLNISTASTLGGGSLYFQREKGWC